MVLLCEGKFVVFHVDAQNILGIFNRGSPRLKLDELARDLFLVRRGAQCHIVGGVGAGRAEFPSRRAIKVHHHPRRRHPRKVFLPVVGGAMGDPRDKPFRVGREQPVRMDLLAALVPGNGGSKRVCLLLGRGARVGDLMPLQASGPSLAEVETRRSHGHCACAVVGIRHVVGTGCARRGAIF